MTDESPGTAEPVTDQVDEAPQAAPRRRLRLLLGIAAVVTAAALGHPFVVGLAASILPLVISEQVLDHLTEETGGRVLFANSNKDLRATLTQTLSEFRDRYVLSYTPTGVSPTGWHRLDVRLKAKSGSVTARRGYFAE